MTSRAWLAIRTRQTHHFDIIHATFKCMGIQEDMHKASAPAQVMIWLGLKFDTDDMSITIPAGKKAASMQLGNKWSHKSYTKIHKLSTVGQAVLCGPVLPASQNFCEQYVSHSVGFPHHGCSSTFTGVSKRHAIVQGIPTLHEQYPSHTSR